MRFRQEAEYEEEEPLGAQATPTLSRSASVVDFARREGAFAVASSFRYCGLEAEGVPVLGAFAAGKYVIDPQQNNVVPVWDVMMICLIIIVSFVTPYEVGFCLKREDPLIEHWITKACLEGVNVVFCVDVFLQLFISAPSPINHRWVRMPNRIIKNYLRGSFIVDAISVIPWDQLLLRLPKSQGDHSAALGVLRVFGLLKLIRVKRLITRYESRVDVQFSHIKIANLLMALTLTVHWMACAWGCLLSWQRIYGMYPGNTWADGLRDTHPGWFADAHVDQPKELYVGALYWSAVTIISVGYGDVVATNSLEAVAALIAMALSGLIWANIIGEICAFSSSRDVETVATETSISSLNFMMRTFKMPNEQRMCLRELFVRRKVLFYREQQVSLLRCMSPEQQALVARSVHTKMMEKVWYFGSNSSDAFVVGIFERLAHTVYPPREKVQLVNTLVYMKRGVALHACNTLDSGSVWGIKDLILTNTALLDNMKPLTLSYVELQLLFQGRLMELLVQHLPERHRIRRAAIWLAVQQAVRRRIVEPLTDEELQELGRKKREEDNFHISLSGACPRVLAVQQAKFQKNIIGKLDNVIFLMEKHFVKDPTRLSYISHTSATHSR